MNDQTKPSPSEENLLACMQALDSQVAREMQRAPAEREAHGVQKWEPYQKRVERMCAFVLNSLGDQAVELDSVLILAQALAKTLRLVVDDLGPEGLGKVRSEYCQTTFEGLSKDSYVALQRLKQDNSPIVS